MERLSEFEIIKRYFVEANYPTGNDLILGPGDDCAILKPQPGQRLCVSIDTLVSGVHFPQSADARLIAHRSLAVNVSDLAAMGASPNTFLLAMTIPEFNEDWLHEFSQTMAACARSYAITLAGGDLTRGPLSITLQVTGTVPDEFVLIRSGAGLDDDIYVTGSLGDAAAGLDILLRKGAPKSDHEIYLYERYAFPEARVAAGQRLLKLASSAIDISDGLLGDLAHITGSSGCGALVYTDRIPLSEPLSGTVSGRQALDFALAGGDDYELCFTAHRDKRSAVDRAARDSGLVMTRIGKIVADREIVCVDQAGKRVSAPDGGYRHF
jgi:thiamine-monophosphate kinase